MLGKLVDRLDVAQGGNRRVSSKAAAEARSASQGEAANKASKQASKSTLKAQLWREVEKVAVAQLDKARRGSRGVKKDDQNRRRFSQDGDPSFGDTREATSGMLAWE